MNFGERLRGLREKQNLSREKMAKMLGLSYWALSKYETGEREPDFGTLRHLADYFEVSADYLLGRTDVQSGDSLERFSDFPEPAGKEIEDFIEYIRRKYMGKN